MIRHFIVFLMLVVTLPAYALDLELTQGINAPLPIGINSFGSDLKSQELNKIIAHDLQFSGQFNVLLPAQQREDEQSIHLWKKIGADSVLSGQLIENGNRYDINITLADASSDGRLLLAENYQINPNQLRGLAHHISDQVYQKLTGERGIFSTRIAYVYVKREGNKTQYSLEIAEIDGSNPHALLISSEPIMSPAWSPDGKQLAYVSFEKKRAQIFNVNVASGQRRLLTDFPGINGAPAWSPDGSRLAVVLSKSGNPKIYTVDLSTGALKQLTFGDSIDTEPRFSADGQYLLFTSGRGGSPQIYRLSLADLQITRISYDGNYNARASYTPNQQYIVMLHREDQQFNIGVQNVANGGISSVTNSQMDESPSVSPNGRLILYATHYQDQGVLAIVSIDGHIKMRLPTREGDIQEPAWSPYLMAG